MPRYIISIELTTELPDDFPFSERHNLCVQVDPDVFTVCTWSNGRLLPVEGGRVKEHTTAGVFDENGGEF